MSLIFLSRRQTTTKIVLFVINGLKDRLDQMFKDCYHSDYQLICSSPLAHKYLTLFISFLFRYIAMGLIIRGPVAFSDVNRNIKKIKEEIDIVYWNKEGFKYGICNVPPVGQVSFYIKK